MVNKKYSEILLKFQNSKVLITGNTGFIGSWLSLCLLHAGAKVKGIGLKQEQNSLFYLCKLHEKINHTELDILNYQKLRETIEDFEPEYIFHLAAQPIVSASYENPKLTFDTNISGSVNILEAVRNTSSVKSFVYVTSDKCYKNKDMIWGYRESDELGGRDPYSASKAAAEIVFQSYLQSFFEENTKLGVASARLGNVIGGGDWSQDRLMPSCIQSLINKQTIVIRKPSATRPWHHVFDLVRGLLYLAYHLHDNPRNFNGSWNFGSFPNRNNNVLQFCKEVINIWGKGDVLVETENQFPFEHEVLHLNIDKTNLKLGWEPYLEFEEAISETVKWYKNVFQGECAYQISKKQINSYINQLG
ncbi:CDP-glucose 4,6-dehydratase [Bacillus cereus]|nr:CDP-glucose 4,6-dehydratase [Bacillus cereus]MDA2079904.1 CDP-glucose 4,6-dehydratase [Bacillus cereus]MDA2085494.1 CDP-glucose 4,6-dehydratase [Bacillus cereus]MDA2178596.1 CDP-glucose 4,6-dehydratase [Bacillus cereus]